MRGVTSRTLIGAVCSVAIGGPALANDNAVDDCASDVSDQQSVVGFSSLIDGQPTDPNAPTLGLALSGTRGTDSVQSSVQLAPGSERGWCDAVLFAQLPALLIDDGASLSMTAGVGWEQRWQEDTATTPTLATLLTASVDFGGLSTVVVGRKPDASAVRREETAADSAPLQV